MAVSPHAKRKPSRNLKRPPLDFLRRRALELVTTLEALHDELIAQPEDAKALHEYRKQTRRVTAGYQLLELFFKPTEYASIQALTSVLSKGLGKWRDADVLDKRLQDLARGKSKTAQEQFNALRKKIASGGRSRRVTRACRRSARERLREPLEELLGYARPQLADPLALLRDRLRLRAQSALSEIATTQQLHAFRLELKSYRYALETLDPSPRSVEASMARQAHQVTDILGRLVDAEVLEAKAAEAGPLAARVILAAARKNAMEARQEFEKGWGEKRWPELQAAVGDNGQQSGGYPGPRQTRRMASESK